MHPRMRPEPPRRPFAAPTSQVPPVQGKRGFPERRFRLDGVEQVSIVTFPAAEVLAPKLEPKVASELANAVAEAGRISGFARIAFRVQYRAGDLGVMAP